MTDAGTPPLRRRPVPAETTVPPAAAPDLDAVSEAVSEALPPVPPLPVAPAPRAPVIEAPSVDVAPVPSASRVPGTARDGYHQLPTAPVITTATGPVEGEAAAWAAAEAAPPAPRAAVGPWALGLAIVALAASVFVGWMLPVALAAVIAAIVALRRPAESRPLAVWALALGAVALLYSAGWLLWALPQLPPV